MRHSWTSAEMDELKQDIETQGFEIAVSNFSSVHGIDRTAVYNKAWNIKKGKVTALKPKEPVVAKQGKVIIMLQKEMMKELDIDMTQGKITIKYPKDYMLDLKFM